MTLGLERKRLSCADFFINDFLLHLKMDINNHFQIKILELERFQTLQYLKRLIVRPKNPTILLFTQYKKSLIRQIVYD